MEREERIEREISGDLELRAPDFIPGKYGFQLGFKRRREIFIKEVLKSADVTEEALLGRIEEGDSFSDIFSEGARAAIASGDTAVQNTFARLVALALRDDAAIDSVAYTLRKMEILSPFDIRLFWSICKASVPRAHENLIALLIGELKAERFIIEDGLQVLQGQGFILRSPDMQTDNLSPLGNLAKKLIGEIDSTLTHSSR